MKSFHNIIILSGEIVRVGYRDMFTILLLCLPNFVKEYEMTRRARGRQRTMQQLPEESLHPCGVPPVARPLLVHVRGNEGVLQEALLQRSKHLRGNHLMAVFVVALILL